MKRDKTMVFILLIGAVIVIAALIVFGSTIFFDTPVITLPAPSEEGPGGQTGEDVQVAGTVRVQVTPETVQAVIATLDRMERYSRTIEVEYFWGEAESEKTTVQVWVDRERTRIRTMFAFGRVRHVLTDGKLCHIWEDGDRTWYKTTARERSGDLEQQIPTYETILQLDPRRITTADYRKAEGTQLDCIYVEVEEELLGYTERYWVSVETGLLVCSETWEGERLLYRMSAPKAVTLAAPEDIFNLPDGTPLLSAQEQEATVPESEAGQG